jgi:hypothetical protein
MDELVFRLNLFGRPSQAKRSRRSLLYLMESLVCHNVLWLLAHPSTPKIYQADVIYIEEVGEIWKDIPHIIVDRDGDCEDLACWRVAELRLAGINARPYIKWRIVGGQDRMHALCLWPDGRVEDPSKALGMNGPITRSPEFVEP